jgi:hypothetical protein
MRKHIRPTSNALSPSNRFRGLDLENITVAEVTSEHPLHPFEHALMPTEPGGWIASTPGAQVICLLFERPQAIRRILVQFEVCDGERTQEFTLRWKKQGEDVSREIVRQRWNFSPEGSTSETEDYQVDLQDAQELELTIIPDITGGEALASLKTFRVG